MNSNSNYETLYGVGFLDDLHNYFPALLYDSSSFGNVQSVLGYIQRQTRTRFDLFSYGLREYLSRQPPVAPPPQPSVEHSSRRVVRTSFSSVPSQGLPSLSTLRSSAIPTVSAENSQSSPVHQNYQNVHIEIQRNVQEGEEEEEEEEDTVPAGPADTYIANALLSLLQLPPASLTRNYVLPNLNNGRVTLEQMIYGRNNMDQFLQPVVIRPTPEQIEGNTTVGNLVSDTENTCAICQDALTSEQEGRKLNACGHWFHKSCIDTWLGGNVHCPVCRHDIREPIQTNEV